MAPSSCSTEVQLATELHYPNTKWKQDKVQQEPSVRAILHRDETETVKRIRFAELATLDKDHESHSEQRQDTPTCGTEVKVPMRTRFGRHVVKPAHYKDYI